MKWIFLILFFNTIQAWAQYSFNQCALGESRTELDNLCPRIEGAHLPQCCPQLFKSPPLSCRYHIVKDRGQPYLAQGSYSTCESGSLVSHSCCEVRYKACYVEPVTLSFLPRLISRSNACCFENCPPAQYWLNGRRPGIPQYAEMAKLTAQHELTNGGLQQCVAETLPIECDTPVACGASSSCPVVDPGPGPDPGPTDPPTDPGPGPIDPGPIDPGPYDPPPPPPPVDPGGT